MLAYTAWDSLQTIARQYDAYLTFVSDDHLTLVPHRRFGAATVRRATLRISAVVAGLVADLGLIVA